MKKHSIKKDKNKLKKRTEVIFIVLIFSVIFIALFAFVKNNKTKIKTKKIGNNSTSQEVVNYVLDIKSYEAKIDVEIKSNKNSNRYKMRQKYIDENNNEQEIVEPSNIGGIKIIKKNNKLRIENSKLSVVKIIENYKEITGNNLDLVEFINNYKENSNSKFKEKDNQIIMETVLIDENKYQKYETLYIEKETGKPLRLEIKDTNQNTIIYIIYSEIKI